MLTYLVSKKVRTMLALEFSTDFRFVCLSVLMNDKVEFKKAVQKYLNTHSFYSVDEFLMCT
jgi:hypothetical protein